MGEAAHRLELAASGRAAAVAGTVRITASEVVATWVLPPILAALRLAEPEIDVELVAVNASGNLLRREADVAVRMYRPEQADVIARRVADMPVAGYASVDYVARRGNPTELDEVAGHDLVGHDTDDRIVRGFRAAGLELARESFSLRCDDQLVCWRMVLAGWGIGFVSRCVGDAEARAVPVFGNRTVAVLPVWLVAHEELRTSARVRRVWDALAEGLGGAGGSAPVRDARRRSPVGRRRGSPPSPILPDPVGRTAGRYRRGDPAFGPSPRRRRWATTSSSCDVSRGLESTARGSSALTRRRVGASSLPLRNTQRRPSRSRSRRAAPMPLPSARSTSSTTSQGAWASVASTASSSVRTSASTSMP